MGAGDMSELERAGGSGPHWTDALWSALPDEVRAELPKLGAEIRRAHIARMATDAMGTNLLRLLTILAWCVREIGSIRKELGRQRIRSYFREPPR